MDGVTGPDWERFVDEESSFPYFYNAQTGESIWDTSGVEGTEGSAVEEGGTAAAEGAEGDTAAFETTRGPVEDAEAVEAADAAFTAGSSSEGAARRHEEVYEDDGYAAAPAYADSRGWGGAAMMGGSGGSGGGGGGGGDHGGASQFDDEDHLTGRPTDHHAWAAHEDAAPSNASPHQEDSTSRGGRGAALARSMRFAAAEAEDLRPRRAAEHVRGATAEEVAHGETTEAAQTLPRSTSRRENAAGALGKMLRGKGSGKGSGGGGKGSRVKASREKASLGDFRGSTRDPTARKAGKAGKGEKAEKAEKAGKAGKAATALKPAKRDLGGIVKKVSQERDRALEKLAEVTAHLTHTNALLGAIDASAAEAENDGSGGMWCERARALQHSQVAMIDLLAAATRESESSKLKLQRATRAREEMKAQLDTSRRKSARDTERAVEGAVEDAVEAALEEYRQHEGRAMAAELSDARKAQRHAEVDRDKVRAELSTAKHHLRNTREAGEQQQDAASAEAAAAAAAAAAVMAKGEIERLDSERTALQDELAHERARGERAEKDLAHVQRRSVEVRRRIMAEAEDRKQNHQLELQRAKEDVADEQDRSKAALTALERQFREAAARADAAHQARDAERRSKIASIQAVRLGLAEELSDAQGETVRLEGQLRDATSYGRNSARVSRNNAAASAYAQMGSSGGSSVGGSVGNGAAGGGNVGGHAVVGGVVGQPTQGQPGPMTPGAGMERGSGNDAAGITGNPSTPGSVVEGSVAQSPLAVLAGESTVLAEELLKATNLLVASEAHCRNLLSQTVGLKGKIVHMSPGHTPHGMHGTAHQGTPPPNNTPQQGSSTSPQNNTPHTRPISPPTAMNDDADRQPSAPTGGGSVAGDSAVTHTGAAAGGAGDVSGVDGNINSVHVSRRGSITVTHGGVNTSNGSGALEPAPTSPTGVSRNGASKVAAVATTLPPRMAVRTEARADGGAAVCEDGDSAEVKERGADVAGTEGSLSQFRGNTLSPDHHRGGGAEQSPPATLHTRGGKQPVLHTPLKVQQESPGTGLPHTPNNAKVSPGQDACRGRSSSVKDQIKKMEKTMAASRTPDNGDKGERVDKGGQGSGRSGGSRGARSGGRRPVETG